MKTCIVVDDDFPQIRLMRNLIAQRGDIKCVNSFVNPAEAVNYLKSNPVDIAFFDIEMNDMNGLKLSEHLSTDTKIIFITVSPNYALDAFNVGAADYLLKPVEKDKFDRAINKAIALLNIQTIETTELEQKQKQSITILVDRKLFKLHTNDIIYIKSLREYVCIYTIDNKYVTLSTLKEITDKLPANKFVRIHKSYVVNADHIECFTALSVTLLNKKQLSIGRSYKTEFKSKIN